MSDKERFIIHTARVLARRMNLCSLIRFTSVTMLWGIGLIAILIIISKFWIFPVSVLIISILILAISIISGLIRAFTSRVSPVQALIKAESTLNLKERLSSALEISLQDKKSYLGELQLNDAYQHCRSIKPEVVCPRMFTTSSKLLPLFVVLLFSFNFIPAQYADPYYVPPEVQKDIKDIATELDKKMDELNNEKLSEQERELISDIKEKTRNMQNETISKKDALLVLSNLTRKAEALEIMAEISQELEKEGLSSEQKRLLKEMLDKLYEKLKDIDGLEKLTQVVQKAQKTDLSKEAMQELISALDRVSPRSADNNSVGKASEQLEEARKQVAKIGIKSGNNQTQDENQIETGLNISGEGAPGDNTVSGMDESEIDEYIPVEGYDTELESQVDESGKGISVDMIEERRDKKAIVPYSEVYMEYRAAADENISRNSIPWTYRKHVKDYFDAIKPKERSDGN